VIVFIVFDALLFRRPSVVALLWAALYMRAGLEVFMTSIDPTFILFGCWSIDSIAHVTLFELPNSDECVISEI
jgi:hypothetical protein